MGLGRDIMRAEAKKVYKEQTKGIPKKNRLPFSEFYKKFKQLKAGKVNEAEHDHDHEVVEDFDVSQVANVNKVEDPNK